MPPALELGAHLQHWDSGDRMESSSWECRPNLEGETGFQADPQPSLLTVSSLPYLSLVLTHGPGYNARGQPPPQAAPQSLRAKRLQPSIICSFVRSFIHSLTTEGQTPGRNHALGLQG